NCLHRPVYRVPCANALWHIDGHHKHIKWGFIIHERVDDYSRLITYLNLSNNNLAITVLTHFLKAVDEYSHPSR
uniref:Integrase core domain-containing protein n=1 Tax=Amphimedon queenslandica TaxID=400682 RepID=A0A1X7VPV4_AMPQE